MYQISYGRTVPDDMATLDHLNNRYHPEQRRKADPSASGEWKITTTLACLRCDNGRANEETKSFSNEELYAKSMFGIRRKIETLKQLMPTFNEVQRYKAEKKIIYLTKYLQRGEEYETKKA